MSGCPVYLLSLYLSDSSFLNVLCSCYLQVPAHWNRLHLLLSLDNDWSSFKIHLKWHSSVKDFLTAHRQNKSLSPPQTLRTFCIIYLCDSMLAQIRGIYEWDPYGQMPHRTCKHHQTDLRQSQNIPTSSTPGECQENKRFCISVLKASSNLAWLLIG